MILRQFLHTDPVGISYLLGCGGKATGAVVDPVADVGIYLDAARGAGMKIDYVIDTHVHADHLSTGRCLADAAGAKYILSEKADVAIPFKGMHDGDEIQLGNVVIKVLSTPGHTPEHICLLVTDRTHARGGALVRGHWAHLDDWRSRSDGACNECRARREGLVRQHPKVESSSRLPRGLSRCLCGFGLRAQPKRKSDLDDWL